MAEITPDNILLEADAVTSGDRRNDYGDIAEDFTRIARLWSVLLGVEVEPMSIPLCMIAVKLSRQTNKHKRDNLVDIAGYARTAELLAEPQE